MDHHNKDTREETVSNQNQTSSICNDSSRDSFRTLLVEALSKRLITLSNEELGSDMKQQQEDEEESNDIEDETEYVPVPPQGGGRYEFTCGRCGQIKCTYYETETRHEHEPKTTYVTCVNCYNHWKF
ncbi:unnamed protein product [Cochlearia groenlandica]